MRERFQEAIHRRVPIALRTARALGLHESPLFHKSRGDVAVSDYWLTVKLGDGWCAAIRLMPHRGHAVVGELRVFPVDDFPGREPGQWAAEYLGVRAWERFDAPVHSGITARLLRRVPLGAHLKYARALLSKLGEQGWRELSEHGLHSERRPEKRQRANRRPDVFYARIAAEYAARVADGSRRPVTDLAVRRKVPAAIIRDAVHAARERGLLTLGTPGRPGGTLTPQAKTLLRKGK